MQLDLIETNELQKVVNVASVPKRSPFRYPGGKTWLIPRIRQWLSARPTETLIEPFLGGGIVSLTAVMEGYVKRAIVAELDEAIAAVWITMLDGGGEWLSKQILGFNLTTKLLRDALEREPKDTMELAFQTILRNRCYRGGILAEGSGLMKSGENGRGIHSRWYPVTLSDRILAIHRHRKKFEFVSGDGFALIRKHIQREDCNFFIDPPYTKAARRLYKHHAVDHEGLFELASTLEGDVLLTYDNYPDVRGFAKQVEFEVREIQMKNAHHAHQTELLIGHDLGWLSGH